MKYIILSWHFFRLRPYSRCSSASSKNYALSPYSAATCLQYPQCDPRVIELRTPPRLLLFQTVLFSSPEDRSDSCAATYQKPPLLWKLPEWNSSVPKKMQLRSCSLLRGISLSPVIPAFSFPFSHSFELLAIASISTNSWNCVHQKWSCFRQNCCGIQSIRMNFSCLREARISPDGVWDMLVPTPTSRVPWKKSLSTSCLLN